MSRTAAKLFPLRIRPFEVKVKEATPHTGHKYEPQSHVATVPMGENAYERTIRVHETLHALCSPIEVEETLVAQCAEDLRLHLNHARLTGRNRRDEIASAITDLRTIVQAPAGIVDDNRDDLLAVFLRSVAILQSPPPVINGDPRKVLAEVSVIKGNKRVSRLVTHAFSKLKVRNKKKLGQALKSAFDTIRSTDSVRQAIRKLSPFFNDPNQQSKSVVNPIMKGRLGQDKQSQEFKQWQREQQEAEQLEQEAGCKDEKEFTEKVGMGPTDAMHYLGKESAKSLGQKFKNGYHRVMNIRNLPADVPRESKEKPGDLGAFSGSRIRGKKLAAAYASPVPVRLFERRRPRLEEGGTVLIDASGSMAFSDKHLKEISDAMPAGTVAYYSYGGGNSYGGGSGNLVIVADKGKQYAFPEGAPLPYRGGGNEIDYEALAWLLNQEKPRYIITDGPHGYCGGLCEYASILLINAKLLGALTHFTDIHEMRNYLKEKGKLKDSKATK